MFHLDTIYLVHIVLEAGTVSDSCLPRQHTQRSALVPRHMLNTFLLGFTFVELLHTVHIILNLATLLRTMLHATGVVRNVRRYGLFGPRQRPGLMLHQEHC